MARRPRVSDMVDIYAPPIALLVKLGSIIVHADEGAGEGGHAFDWVAFRALLADRDVIEWLEGMRKAGFLPAKRTG